MTHRTFCLTEVQAHELLTAQTQTKHSPTCLRFQAVRLYGLGSDVALIQTVTGCSRTSLMEWCAAYRDHGLEALRDHRRGGNHRKLTPDQVTDLAQKLRQDTPRTLFGPDAVSTGEGWSLPDLRHAVEYFSGITYQSDSSYRLLFHRCGFSSHRPAQVFRSRQTEAVHAFAEQIETN